MSRDLASEPRLAGTILLDQMQMIRDAHGEAVLARATATLPPEMQRDLEALSPLSWLDTRLVKELKDAVARDLGRDPIEFQRWVVRAAIGNTINRFWRALLSRVWDGAIVKRAPILYAKTYDRGEFKVTSWADHAAELVVTGWSDMPDYEAIGLSVGIEAVLEYAGRKSPRVRFEHKGSVVAFHLTWR